ncbi:D-alanyl-D-alanine carboxypeptidase/D-alanyl-D-alanine-endopeptidase [candidate division KSB1 bacterium]
MIKKSNFINRIFRIVCAIVLLSTCSGRSQHTVENLKEDILNFSRDASVKHASWGICVIDVETGNKLADYNSSTSLIPASTMKIVSTAAALSLLGKDYRFKTWIEMSGQIDATGVLRGNLYLRGGGDPTLGSKRFLGTGSESIFSNWIKAIKNAGIRKIDGRIIADDSNYEGQMIPPSRTWDDMGNYYGTSCSALSYHENYFTVLFKPGYKIGSETQVLRTIPEIPDVQFENQVTTAASGTGDQVIIYVAPFSEIIQLEGTVPIGSKEFSVKGSMPDPAYTLVFSFEKYLKEHGIISAFPATTIRKLKLVNKESEEKRKVLLTHQSPRLEEIIQLTNINSINVFAESMVLITGKTQTGSGSYKSGLQSIASFWKSKGINLNGFNMEDGSGLSRQNLITTEQLSRMLEIFVKDNAYIPFKNSLPLAARTGSLKNIFKGTYAENNLQAKSGYLTATRAYAGYVTNKNDKLLAFAVIVNHYDGTASEMKRKLEKLMLSIAETDFSGK